MRDIIKEWLLPGFIIFNMLLGEYDIPYLSLAALLSAIILLLLSIRKHISIRERYKEGEPFDLESINLLSKKISALVLSSIAVLLFLVANFMDRGLLAKIADVDGILIAISYAVLIVLLFSYGLISLGKDFIMIENGHLISSTLPEDIAISEIESLILLSYCIQVHNKEDGATIYTPNLNEEDRDQLYTFLQSRLPEHNNIRIHHIAYQ